MIQPINGRILVKADRLEQTEGGIIIPKEVVDKDRPETGLVVSGSEKIPTGTHIVFSMYGFDEITEDGQTFLLVAEHNVLAFIV